MTNINLQSYLESIETTEASIIRIAKDDNDWNVLEVKPKYKSDDFTNETWVILHKRSTDYCTHEAYIDNHTGEVSFGTGHYNIPLEQALEDFNKR